MAQGWTWNTLTGTCRYGSHGVDIGMVHRLGSRWNYNTESGWLLQGGRPPSHRYALPHRSPHAEYVRAGRIAVLALPAGIDPAYALAFGGGMARQAGTRGVARSTRSRGNMHCRPDWPHCVRGSRAYDSYAAGMADGYTLIRTLYIRDWGLTTPAATLTRYTPAGDGNDPAGYAATVQALVDSLARYEHL